ncbi:uncharacterized protein LOC113205808 [Frankliniella occidentalis]|uniref:Uncharacterized protein LOC113205808 n=1 Tax=Frankliniella occidentalis TaxID=133901 RepID=A0A9C6X391_FRAOC|nr:uncharacterized protein LOC113205808 [Frankliniella occidentalis]
MIVYSLTYSATCVSTAVDSLVEMQDSLGDGYSVKDTLVPLQAGLGRIFLFLYACSTFQRAAQEHSKLSQELQGFLADTPDVPVAVLREVERFIVQIGLRDGYFDVLSLFRLDIGAMRTILAATATYLFVLMQFGISMY